MSKHVENKRVVPRLRFPEFGIAEEWRVESFGDLYAYKSTNSFSRDNLTYDSGLVKDIHYGDIHTKFSTLFDITREKVPYIKSSVSIDRIKLENYCIEGDMIFADASEDLYDVGKSIEVVFLNNERLLSGLHTLLARQKAPKLVLGFGGYLFMSDGIRAQIRRESQGAKVLGISSARLSDISIYYPESKEEQRKIVDCLSSMDEIVNAQYLKLDALKAHKRGLMQQLFPNNNEGVPTLRFPQYQSAGEWIWDSLGDYSTKVGSGITPAGGNKNYTKEGRPFVRSQNIGWGVLLLDDIAFINEQTHATFLGSEIEKDDVLLNITGASIGRCALADARIIGGNVNQHVCIIRTKSNLNPFFLAQYLISEGGQKQIWSFQAGGNRQGLNYVQIRSFSIPIPPDYDEQGKIAECLFSIDEMIIAQTEKIDILRAQKNGLAQHLFPSITIKTNEQRDTTVC